ncbi:MAG: hypothetical protein Q8L87_21000, partial [Anaerolineales bacterium]|nr:hypothetical protein [Anaerolineales bacterium]
NETGASHWLRLFFYVYNAHGHIMPVGYKLHFPPSEKAQFVTALGILAGVWHPWNNYTSTKGFIT